MRSREEVLLAIESTHSRSTYERNIAILEIAVELLLDIRGQLSDQQYDPRPLITHPVSPPPPKVKT